GRDNGQGRSMMALVGFVGHQYQIGFVIDLIMVQHMAFLCRPVIPLLDIAGPVAQHRPVVANLIWDTQPDQYIQEFAVRSGSNPDALTDDDFAGAGRDDLAEATF